MKCLISKKEMQPFHVFPARTIFNKPVNELPKIATTSMELCYNFETSHISSSTSLNDSEMNLIEEIYTNLYTNYAEVGMSKTQLEFTDFIGQWLLNLVDKPSNVLEIASHDGYLLNKFKTNGHKVFGIEPSPMAEISKSKFGLEVENDFFDKSKFDDCSMDLVIMRHVLEHVEDPVEFLDAAYSKLKTGGKLYIEVPNSFWSLENCYFPEFHIDHISYFTIGSLYNIISKLPGVSIDRIEQFNGYIKFPFLGAVITKTEDNHINNLINPLQDFSMPSLIENFKNSYQRYMDNLLKIDTNGKLIVWGTGSIGTQFAVDAKWSKDDVFYVDINPNSHGLKISSTGHEIFSPEKISEIKPSAIIIASAWENDVRSQLQNYSTGKENIISFSNLLS